MGPALNNKLAPGMGLEPMWALKTHRISWRSRVRRVCHSATPALLEFYLLGGLMGFVVDEFEEA